MHISLKPRAEDYAPEEISYIEQAIHDDRAVFRVRDYLHSSSNNPLFITGPKGTGKTLNVRMALNNEIRENGNSLPVMSIQQGDNTVLMHPLKLASEADWGQERRERLGSLESKEEALENANPLVVDDIHYRVESFVGKPDERERANAFVGDMKRYLEESKKGKKTIFISESPLNAYAEKLRIKEYQDVFKSYRSCNSIF